MYMAVKMWSKHVGATVGLFLLLKGMQRVSVK